MDITTAVDILTFISKFAYCYFLAGIVVFSGMYIFVIGYGMYLGRNDPYVSSNGYWFRGGSRHSTEACNKFNKRKVFRLIFVLAILFKIFWI